MGSRSGFRIAGLKVADKIWITDPPSSSFPACIEVKCAEDQSPALGALYLKAAREAVIVHGKNMPIQPSCLTLRDGFRFRNPDLTRKCSGGRSPTLVLKGGGKAVLLRGYQSWEVLQHTADSLVSSDKQV